MTLRLALAIGATVILVLLATSALWLLSRFTRQPGDDRGDDVTEALRGCAGPVHASGLAREGERDHV